MHKELIVTILCTAYNHEPYIRKCLEGFVMQKTNFQFEAIVHDDASTDGTATIIREYAEKYPDIIVPIYQTENQYSKKIGIYKTFLYPKAQGKYIAICEGDDYWTDPYKLQKQVDLLEANLDCSFCCGGYIQEQAGKEDILQVEKRGDSNSFKFTLDEWLNDKWFTMPLTTMYRNKEFIIAIAPCRDKYRYYRDVHMYHHLLLIGKGLYVSENWANHIFHPGGVASMQPHYIVMRNANNIYREIYKVMGDVRYKKLVRLTSLERMMSIDKTESKLKLFLVALSVSQSFHDVKMSCIVFIKVILRKIKSLFVDK